GMRALHSRLLCAVLGVLRRREKGHAGCVPFFRRGSLWRGEPGCCDVCGRVRGLESWLCDAGRRGEGPRVLAAVMQGGGVRGPQSPARRRSQRMSFMRTLVMKSRLLVAAEGGGSARTGMS